MTSDSTFLTYYWNWRVVLCAISILLPMLAASFMIWKYEFLDRLKSVKGESHPETAWFIQPDDAWKPCLRSVHPVCLLAFRVAAFCLLLAIIVKDILLNGGSTLYFYTQWTFILVTIYFGLGVFLSVYGCLWRGHQEIGSGHDIDHFVVDTESGYYVPLPHGEATDLTIVRHGRVSQIAGFCSHLLQVIFQINAGAVMLTDCVYWLIIFPSLTIKEYNLSFMAFNLHSLNAIFLLGDTALNSLRFPWFRISYFVLWTGIYVIFQWIIHACIPIWWPYPFLDLSSPYAALWYAVVALMHIPCFSLFALIVKMKHKLMSRCFPQSYDCR
ncbi:hypothetical protein RJ641_006950 [Dillenia turbinata]|uniref:Uncharacterized protein n=1 Tax=Dillenia turbinata TaxID=194707 RepID=A0AAN8V7S0_9MAGN